MCYGYGGPAPKQLTILFYPGPPLKFAVQLIETKKSTTLESRLEAGNLFDSRVTSTGTTISLKIRAKPGLIDWKSIQNSV